MGTRGKERAKYWKKQYHFIRKYLYHHRSNSHYILFQLINKIEELIMLSQFRNYFVRDTNIALQTVGCLSNKICKRSARLKTMTIARPFTIAIFVMMLTHRILGDLSFVEPSRRTYDSLRKAIIQAEGRLTAGGDISLTATEMMVNDRLMKAKQQELTGGFRYPQTNAAAMHFFEAKPLIESSKVFAFIRQMPKGAILHVHNSASVSSDWVVKNISYMPGLLRCKNSEGVDIWTFRVAPKKHRCQGMYVLISEERHRFVSSAEYDRNLESMINLERSLPDPHNTSMDSVWPTFENMFTTISDVLKYIPAFRSYHRRLLEEMYEDNIMYAELRISFDELYDSEGNIFPPERSVNELLRIIQEFRLEHPQFLGVKAIVTTQRDANEARIKDKFNKFKALHSKYPNFILGFDLVGEEDKGKPLYDFVDTLADLPKSARYFFHAGETNWYGSSIDYNLLDAILLNTIRIGHGYALMKHPLLWDTVRKRNIAIEVNPISNQVLGLVSDLRNHPGAFLISQNIPIVISNDDPGFWNAKGLSYDFYYAFMSLAPNNADLKILKKFAWNSIHYSVLNPSERRLAFSILEKNWDNFLDKVVQGCVV